MRPAGSTTLLYWVQFANVEKPTIGGVGKSCLTAQFVHNEWIESYDPTIEDSYRTQVSVDGRQVVLEILDTAGTEQFGSYGPASSPGTFETDSAAVAMRDLYMKTGQGFLLVFSIASSSSLAELAGLRDEIIRIKDDENVPIVICGNKADLEDQRTVPRTKGFSLSQRWGAPYYESSARTRTNVDEVFVDLCRQMLRRDDAGENYLQEEPEFDPYSISYYKKRRKQRRDRDKDPHRPKTEGGFNVAGIAEFVATVHWIAKEHRIILTGVLNLLPEPPRTPCRQEFLISPTNESSSWKSRDILIRSNVCLLRAG
ncbi:putative P-loop containing nucleoside triphosphate hydrolase protein [Seiridium unicorne]|uniref:P-loop containing nucleoside triphosphate hydrolase protein n=1 Tax=Seiridium unicorne TaxID=138068 RepID=A0ABR2UQU3_9PEZI